MKVFIGWDSREQIAYQVAKYSIRKYNKGVEIIPIKQHELRNRGIYTRPEDAWGSTEFSLTRFLTPYLANYEGMAVFMDCDVLVQTNIESILDDIDMRNVVSCVQHDYTPYTHKKMDGKVQHVYPRKNWSSVMVFNCKECDILQPSSVNVRAPKYLHRMEWAREKIGSLPHTWNYLAGYYDDIEKPNVIHYTDGGPWFENYKFCPMAKEWEDTKDEMLSLPADFKQRQRSMTELNWDGNDTRGRYGEDES